MIAIFLCYFGKFLSRRFFFISLMITIVSCNVLIEYDKCSLREVAEHAISKQRTMALAILMPFVLDKSRLRIHLWMLVGSRRCLYWYDLYSYL